MSRIGSGLVGGGLLVHVAILLRKKEKAWIFPLVLLALKAAAQLVAAFAVGFWFADYHGLRVLYLHIMLIGFVTSGLVAGAYSLGYIRAWSRTLFFVSVAALLLSLVPLSELLPLAWKGGWTQVVATWVPIAVIAAAGGLLRRRS